MVHSPATAQGPVHLVREAYAGGNRSSSGARQDARGRLVSTGTSGRGESQVTNAARGGTFLTGDRAAPRTGRPDYVARCPYSGTQDARQPLMLHTWPMGEPSRATRRVALCGSWRCPNCTRYRASVDFARIRDALAPVDHRDVVFVVLTLDRDGFYSGSAWADAETAYRALSSMSRRWLKRLNRWLEREGLDQVGSRWVGTVEAHRSGWPHLNLVLVSRGLAERLRQQWNPPDATARECTLLRAELLYSAMDVGWGPQSTAEVARSKEALAGYIVKLAGELDQAWGAMAAEVTKVTQVPLSAPKGTRRLRSGRHFLPPRRHDPMLTGMLLLRYDGPTGPCARQYGRRSTTPAPWEPALDRLKALRRGEALALALAREVEATYSPTPPPSRVVARADPDRSKKRDGPTSPRGPP